MQQVVQQCADKQMINTTAQSLNVSKKGQLCF
jgi:hypothetical protein